MEVQSLMARFFSERMSRVSNRSLQIWDSDAQLEASTSSFDQYLTIIRKEILSSPIMTPVKVRVIVAKLIETFLNVLEDLETTTLDPDIDVPPLLRNCFQLSLTVVPFLNDQEVQNFLLERLLAISFTPLSPLSAKLVVQGLFRLLSKLSAKQSSTNARNEQLETQHDFDSISGDIKPQHLVQKSTDSSSAPYIRNIDSQLKVYDRSRKRLAEHLSSSLLDFIVSRYLKIASSTQPLSFPSNFTSHQSTVVNLSSEQSKRSKTLDISNAATPFLNAEKLLVTFFKQSKLIFEHDLSTASIALLAPGRLGELLSNGSVSTLIRHSINDMFQAIIISTRNTTLELELKSKWENLWTSTSKSILLSTMPSKLVSSLAELQGLLLYTLRLDKKYDLFEYSASGVYKREAISRSIPLFALRAWLELVTALFKINIYTSTPLSAECGVWIGSVLISASLEQAPQPILQDICKRLSELSRLPAPSMPTSLHAIASIISENVPDEAIKNMPPGHLAKLILSGFLTFRQLHPDHARDLTPYFTKLVKHIDDVIEHNRSELNSNGTKFGRYDDAIYDFASFSFKAVPHWLHSKSDARYNVFGRMMTELFLDPIKSMAPITVSDSVGNLGSDSFLRSGSPHTNSSSSNLSSRSATTAAGMIFGKSSKASTSASSSKNGSNHSNRTYSTSNVGNATSLAPTKLVPPHSINDNAIRYLPFALHAIAQLPFETDGDMQRYTAELVTSIFRAFVSGKDGSHDARLIEQLAAGLVETSTITVSSFNSHALSSSNSIGLVKSDPSRSSNDAIEQQNAVMTSRIRSFRIFFCANVIPWITLLIQKNANESSSRSSTDNAYDTNCFVLARLLSWLFLKLRHSKEQPALEIIKSFLLTSHYVLDLFRNLKPTVGALAKKEMLNYFIIFCSTIQKLVPHSSVLIWLQTNESWLYEQLTIALREWLAAVVRDLDYISTASWPPAPPEADDRTDIRKESINSLFSRTQDSTISLSRLVLVDSRGSIDSLRELAKALCEAIDFIRQLGATQLIKNIHERVQSILYLPDEVATAQRHSRGDIKAALEAARKDFGKITWLMKNM